MRGRQSAERGASVNRMRFKDSSLFANWVCATAGGYVSRKDVDEGFSGRVDMYVHCRERLHRGDTLGVNPLLPTGERVELGPSCCLLLGERYSEAKGVQLNCR